MILWCVLRSGGIYDPAWVERLYRGARLHWGSEQSLRFRCMTDIAWTPPPGIEITPLRHCWPGWWSKMELFAPEHKTCENSIYLDLDNIIVGNLASIADRKVTERFGFATMADPLRADGGLMTSVMRWSKNWMTNRGHILYEAFSARPEKWMERCCQVGDQGFIEGQMTMQQWRWSRFSPEQVASYKHDLCASVDQKRKYAVIQFHGNPKPHELPEWSALRREWEGKL